MIRIGRVALPGWLETVDRSDGLSLSGVIEAGSYREMMALVDAVNGLVENPDEPVVPVVVDKASIVEFCRVADVSWDFSEYEEGQWWAGWSLSAEPIGNDLNPVVESALTGHVRANSNSLTAAAFHHSVPAGYDFHSWLPTGTAQSEERATAPGPAAGGVQYRRVTAGSGLTVASFAVAPDRWYRGGCYVETLAGGTWVPVVGRRSLAQPWRMSNGLVRVTLVEGGLTPGRVRIEWWRSDGQGWVAQEFGLRTGGSDATAWRAVEVTELSAHTVTIRAQSARAQGRTTLTMTLRRGDRTVSCSLDTDALGDHRVSVLPATAVTDATTHAHLPSAIPSSGGCVWVFTAADDFDVNTTSGVFTPDNPIAQTWSFGLSAYFQGATGDSGSRDQTMRNWYANQTESVVFT